MLHSMSILVFFLSLLLYFNVLTYVETLDSLGVCTNHMPVFSKIWPWSFNNLVIKILASWHHWCALWQKFLSIIILFFSKLDIFSKQDFGHNIHKSLDVGVLDSFSIVIKSPSTVLHQILFQSTTISTYLTFLLFSIPKNYYLQYFSINMVFNQHANRKAVRANDKCQLILFLCDDFKKESKLIGRYLIKKSIFFKYTSTQHRIRNRFLKV